MIIWEYVIIGSIMLIFGIIGMIRLYPNKISLDLDVSIDRDPPKTSKEPIYFKLNGFTNFFIKVIDYDYKYYVYVYPCPFQNKWGENIEMDEKDKILKIYTRINFDPFNLTTI